MFLFNRLVLGLLALALCVAGPRAQAVQLTWQVDTQKMQFNGQSFLFPLPLNDFGQKVSYQVDGASKVEPVDGPKCNNLIRIFPSAPRVSVRVNVTSDVTGLKDLTSYLPARDADTPAEAKPYLKVTYGLDQTTPAIVQLAGTLKGGNHLDSVKNVLRFVGGNIKYDLKYWPTTDDVLTRKTAQCEGLSALAVALLRQLGIPARMMFIVLVNGDGQAAPQAPQNVVDGHTFIQFYLPGCGWQMGDPATLDKIFNSCQVVLGEEPVPYYYCRTGAAALLGDNETLPQNYPAMWEYLQRPQNADELAVASTMSGFFKVLYNCTVIKDAPPGQFLRVPGQKMTATMLRARLENSKWRWPGQMGWFRLKAGGSVENPSNNGSGRWIVNPDGSVTLSFSGTQSKYRFQFTNDVHSFHAVGLDNTETIDSERLE